MQINLILLLSYYLYKYKCDIKNNNNIANTNNPNYDEKQFKSIREINDLQKEIVKAISKEGNSKDKL